MMTDQIQRIHFLNCLPVMVPVFHNEYWVVVLGRLHQVGFQQQILMQEMLGLSSVLRQCLHLNSFS